MIVQTDTSQKSMRRPKGSVWRARIRQSTKQGNLSGTGKGKRQNVIYKSSYHLREGGIEWIIKHF